MEKLFWKIPFYKLPFKYKMFTAKLLQHMFRGFGETYPNDIVLHVKINEMKAELDLWIQTEGRPSTSNPNYHINTN